MYRLLIIDNEPIIVDGLYDLFNEVEHVELEVYKAYSAAEALEQLAMFNINIVFADIHMPEMNGLELQQHIKERWPRCKLIFLTGFNEFSYVQTAMRNGGLDYVLKTEGDERILDAFDKAIASLEEITEKDRFIEEAKQEMYLAKPMLQKEYLVSLLNGDRSYSENIKRKFNELDIPLQTDLPVQLIVGRMDEWPEDYTTSDRVLLMYAIHNIAKEYLAFSHVIPISYDQSKFVWLLQVKATVILEDKVADNRIHEVLDSIQSTCRNLLKITISLVTHAEPCHWRDISTVFASLNRLLGRGLGLEKESLLTDAAAAMSIFNKSPFEDGLMIQNYRNHMPLLESHLEGGAILEFSTLCRSMLQSSSRNHYVYTEIYYSIATMILSYLNRMDVTWSLLEHSDLDGLMRIEEHKTWEIASHYFEGIAQLLLERRQNEKELNSQALLVRIQQYINSHLEDDLSLTQLSEVVYLNPSYLSRLYKQMTNHGLTEYIAEKRIDRAKALLKQTPYKIHEVAKQVGLEVGYFIKLFKKHLNMTPQEYRETNR
ncbi:response regulator [Paenibacillus psychroresistens]|uniref:Response regulator n=1 Tax=Paenibacillus psychroresistens TaxID=1778678 RepID=A0A6B8RWM8_9BACL|nr:response regulator [Paenibacillus psychroresistens]QGQ99586.1 response regulator [Paenibacillus psychroresistens]